jgi:hypothetical protein
MVRAEPPHLTGVSTAKSYISIAVVAFCALFSGWVVSFPLTNTDIWWHLAAAREMIARGGFLYQDPFSFTNPGAAWIDLHWLFQLCAYGLYRLGGAAALVSAKAITTATVCILLSIAWPSRRSAALTAVVAALTFFETRYLILARPTMVTLLCMAAFIALLERCRRERDPRYLIPLPLIQIVWTNAQGLFVLGLVIAGAYAAEALIEYVVRPACRRDSRQASPYAAALAALAASVFVNPYGVRGALFPLRLFGRIEPALENIYSQNVSENLPLLALQGADQRYLVVVVVVTAITLAGFALNRRRPRWAHVMMIAGFLYLAYMAKRNIPLYCIVVAPVIGFHYAAWSMDVRPRTTLRRAGTAVAIALIVALFINSGVAYALIARRYPARTALSPFRYPREATDFVKRHPIAGNMFNAIRYGGYLIWECYPRQRVFIDGRLIIRSPRFFADYLTVCDTPRLFAEVAQQFDIGWVILPTAIFHRYMPLVRRLYRSDQWHLTFTDGASAVFYRADRAARADLRPIDMGDDAVADSIARTLERRWQGDPAIAAEAVGYLRDLRVQLRERRFVYAR